MLAEFFDDKFNSLPASIAHAAKTYELSVEDFVTMDLIGNENILKAEKFNVLLILKCPLHKAGFLPSISSTLNARIFRTNV